MMPTQRRQAILAEVRKSSAVSAEELAGRFGVAVETINSRPRIATGLVGVNYKFHWDNGPVVARY